MMTLIFSVGVSAFDYTFTNSDNVFNSALGDTDIYTKAIDDGKFTPQFADLDNDSIDEIIIFRESGVSFYSGVSLDLINTFNVGNVTSFYIFDYDDDGVPDIMTFVDKAINILSYNGPGTPTQRLINLTETDAIGGEYGDGLISCDAVESCVFMYSVGFNNGFGQQENNLRAFFFNSSVVSDPQDFYRDITSTGHAYKQYATASISYMDSSKDVDKLGGNDYISSWLIDGVLKIYSVKINTSFVPELNGYTDVNDFISGLTGDDMRIYNHYFSEPTVMDFDGASGNGYEYAIAINTDLDEYKILTFESDFSIIDDYPETAGANGLIVSNVIPFNSFPDTGKNDACVLGYNGVDIFGDVKLTFVCGSKITTELVHTNSYGLVVEGSHNISSYPVWENLIYSTDSIQTETDSNNLDEVVTSYGIFSLDESGIDSLELVYINGYDAGSVVLHDVSGVDLPDMLILTQTNLWLIDDKYENAPPQIPTPPYVNPCLDTVWKVNTSVEVRTTPIDSLDKVRARAVLYSGKSYEQNTSWTSYATSGTTQVFNFIANVTATNEKLIIYVNDDNDPTRIISEEYTINVGSNGVVFGDCITYEGTVTVVTDDDDDTSPDLINNSITIAVTNTANQMGLGITLLWLVFMTVLALVIFMIDRDNAQTLDDKSRAVIIVFVEIIMLVIGVKLSFLSSGMLWTLIVLCVIGGGFVIGRKIQGSGD